MGNVSDLLTRIGRGLGAAGRDIGDQMLGGTGPNSPSTLGGRFRNAIHTAANPVAGPMQTLGAFGRGFAGRASSGLPGTSVIPRGGSGTGSVVGRGFIGGGSGGRVGLSNTPSVPSVSRSLGIDRGPSAIERNDPRVNARMGDPDVSEVVGGGGGIELPGGGGRGGNQSNSRARGLGAGQLGQASADLFNSQEARFRARGGLMQER